METDPPTASRDDSRRGRGGARLTIMLFGLVLASADKALYHAKHTGRNRVVRAGPAMA
jgi:GGDEF domain-containing protein